ncbi:hypothetical protein BPJM79_40083 [Bacillus pumilus]
MAIVFSLVTIKFLLIYKKILRQYQKQLLQLLIDNISIRQIDRSKTI